MNSSSSSSSSAESLNRESMLVVVLLAAVVFIAVVNGTMINIALPTIGEHFGATEGVYGWLVSGYSLTFGIFNSINGRLADLYGRRRVYIFGLLSLGVGGLLTAASTSLQAAIVVRVIQGAGAAALPVLGTTITAAVVPEHMRGKALGWILATVGVAASIGPLLGGLVVQYTSWRVVFLIPGLTIFVAPIAWKLLPDELDETSGERFDVVGATLLGVGIGALIFGFNAVRTQGVGTQLIATMVIGVGLIALFMVWIRDREAAFAPFELLSSIAYLRVCLLGFLANLARFASVVLVPIQLSRLNDLEPIAVGGVLFPGALLIAIFSPKSGTWADRSGPRQPVLFAMMLSVIGCLVTALWAGGSVWMATLGMSIIGAGYAFMQTPLINAATQIVPNEFQGVGVGTFMMIFFVGGAFGVAMCSTATELMQPGVWSPISFIDGGEVFANAFGLIGLTSAIGFVLALWLPNKPSVR